MNLNKINKLTKEIKEIKPTCNRTAAIFKRNVIKAKAESWKTYVSKLSAETPVRKIWKKFGKVNGSNKRAPRQAITFEGRRIHDVRETSEAFGKQLARVSSDEFYSNKFKKYKRKKERTKIIFNEDPNREEYYNKEFSEEELNNALAGAKKSAPGVDEINFDMIRHLGAKGKTYLLSLYNHLWNNHEFIEE